MTETRTDEKGIRVNGIVTPHADRDLYEYISQMPVAGGERMRALKQLAAIGLLAKRGAGVAVSQNARPVVESEPSPAATAVNVQPDGPVQKGEVGAVGQQLDATPPAPVAQVSHQATPTAAPTAPGGAYDLSEMDLGDVDLAF